MLRGGMSNLTNSMEGLSYFSNFGGGGGGNNLVFDASSTPKNTTNGNPLTTNALTTTGGSGIAVVLFQANGTTLTCTGSTLGAMTRHGSEITASSGGTMAIFYKAYTGNLSAETFDCGCSGGTTFISAISLAFTGYNSGSPWDANSP